MTIIFKEIIKWFVFIWYNYLIWNQNYASLFYAVLECISIFHTELCYIPLIKIENGMAMRLFKKTIERSSMYNSPNIAICIMEITWLKRKCFCQRCSLEISIQIKAILNLNVSTLLFWMTFRLKWNEWKSIKEDFIYF